MISEKFNFANFSKCSLSWLKVAIAALALSGLYSILIVLLRTPVITHIIPFKDFFRTALVVHVNLSVLVWLLSIAAVFWSKNFSRDQGEELAQKFIRLSMVGMLLMAISPFTGESYPVMNNYVPMLENIIFVLGLSCFFAAILFTAALSLYHSSFTRIVSNITDFAAASSSIIIIMSIMCFIFSYNAIQTLLMEYPLDIDNYYELLFWGGGHVMQFCFTQIMLIVWLYLARQIFEISKKFVDVYLFLLFLNLAFTLPSPLIYFFGALDNGSYHNFFTDQMKYFGGIAPTLFTLVLLINLVFAKNKKFTLSPAAMALFMSVILFIAGGVIALMISGTNVTIPAHYHGSIVGVSIAFMGFAYLYLQQFSINLATNKWATWQPFIYAAGQIMHISGLAWSGGYGVLRKTPGDAFTAKAKISMGLMGAGGLIAIVGGLIFVIICVNSIYPKFIGRKKYGPASV